MNFNLEDVIKFLFPEIQIIEAIKQGGFIVNPNKVKMRAHNTHKVSYNQNSSRTNKYQTNNYETNGNNNYQTRQTNNYKENDKGYSNNFNSSYSGNSSTSRTNENVKVTKENIPVIFDSVRAELGTLLIGQSDYLDNLSIAFKRPFATGYDKLKPRNIVLVIGNRGTGKHSSIHSISRILKEKKVLKSSEVSTIDLSLYATTSQVDVFLSDLYKCLYSKSDVVMFDNFDKCHSSIIEVIETLSTTGRYTLLSRYIFQNNNLVEASGMLTQNSISEITTNEKFFVFSSEKSQNDILNVFGTKFMESVGDIIYTENFSNDELVKISIMAIEDLKTKCVENLSINLNYDRHICERVMSNYKSIYGVYSISDFIESDIYKPLAEVKLKNSISINQTVFLTVIDGEVIARIDDKLIKLNQFIVGNSSFAINDVKKELENIVGIQSVKQYILSIEDNLKVQKIRESAGFKSTNISMHMIFTGNPGTGKTTIARIVAKYLKALGVLSQGQLREVTRGDLVGQYVGHTAKLTNDVIKSALGGVLFIDEAYALCRDKHDTFGLEAIDTLVKGIEDNREDLVVILAGYQGEMEEFLKVNSGLKSRFPNIIDFEDYSSEEMSKISVLTAKSKGYRISQDCMEPLIRLFDKKQIKGRNDSGNGRLVRNIIEGAILNQSKRLLLNHAEPMDLLKYEDFKFEEVEKFDLEANLSKIIGLEIVKEFVRDQYRLLIAGEKRRKAGMVVDTSQAMNMIFSGNPGTGKTTIARLIAEMFKDMGLLKSGVLIETDRGGLVAEYVGQTAQKTEEVFRSALGGVLFIDEAYALSDNNGGFGKEAIDTLVKLIEDYRGEIVVILAGYNKEMKGFLKTNSGLQSRFPLNIDFPDYNADDLFKIALKIINDKGFVLKQGVNILLEEQIDQLHKQSNIHSGNGRMIRNYIEEIIRKQSARIAISDIPADEMNIIIKDDIESENKISNSFNLENELSKIVGLEEIKDYIRTLSARLRVQNERKKLGLTVDSTQTMHMIFKGNPGTGKTMIARTIADVLYNIGVIKTNKLVETDRSGLIAGYVGQTSMKTREKFMEAIDGVLFIDEAYSLSQGGQNDFGKEAVDTLVKLMDDYRDRIVIILAGYSNDMDDFLQINVGLKSRFPNIIEFKDYSTEELMEIAESLFRNKGYEINEDSKNKLIDIFDKVRFESQFGNGRYVRNLYERAINNQAMRLSTDMDLTKEELITVIDTDIERV